VLRVPSYRERDLAVSVVTPRRHNNLELLSQTLILSALGYTRLAVTVVRPIDRVSMESNAIGTVRASVWVRV